MKKMYLAIFLIVLIVFVFAGCLSFSSSIGVTTTEPEEDTYYEDLETTQIVVPPVTEETTLPVVTEPQETTTAAPEITTEPSTAPSAPITVPASNEYNILKSGTFYMKGSMTDKTGVTAPMEIAITADSIYMLSDFSGTPMGMLVKNKTVYMVYPEKKAYLELSDSLMSMAGLDVNELLSTEGISFGDYGDLTNAKTVTDEVYNGRNCQVYHFDVKSGQSKVYMEGEKLVSLASYDKAGKLLSTTDITSISASVPSDKSAPPSNYKAYKGITGMISFMTLLEDVVA